MYHLLVFHVPVVIVLHSNCVSIQVLIEDIVHQREVHHIEFELELLDELELLEEPEVANVNNENLSV
ncbi:MAG: hypothetical protein Q8S84_08135 [bacterium]|nr:hypothetical protein [bacterium]